METVSLQELINLYKISTDIVEEGLYLLRIKNFIFQLWAQKDPQAEALLKWLENEAAATSRTGIIESIRRLKSG